MTLWDAEDNSVLVESDNGKYPRTMAMIKFWQEVMKAWSSLATLRQMILRTVLVGLSNTSAGE